MNTVIAIPFLLIVPIVLLGPIVGLFLIYAGVRMLSLRSYGTAVAASIIALLPCQLIFPLGMLFGIWSLVVLNRKDVREAFAEQSRHRRRHSPPGKPDAREFAEPSYDNRPLPKAALLVATLLAFIIAALFAIPTGIYWLGQARSVGDVLIYRAVQDPSPDGPPLDLDALAWAIDKRVNSGATIARVRPDTSGPQPLIEIGVYGSPNSARTAEVIRRLELRGQLQLRVLADRDVDQAIVDLAEKATTDDVFREGRNGKAFVARWVNVAEPSEVDEILKQNDHLVTRTSVSGKKQTLLLIGPADLTQHHVSQALATTAAGGYPTLEVTFTPLGSTRMTALSTGNLSINDRPRFLGIVVDGTLQSAPAIRGTITDKAQLTGFKSLLEVQNLAAVLNAGPLPGEIQYEGGPFGEMLPAAAVERTTETKHAE